MGTTDLILTIAGTSLFSGGGAAGITGYVGHKLRAAQTQQIAAQAHGEIYKAYGDLLEELRADIAALREQLMRADRQVAELRATIAQLQARERQLLQELGILRAATT